MERKVIFEEMAERIEEFLKASSTLQNYYYEALLNVFLSDDYPDKAVDMSFINDCIVQLRKIDIQLLCFQSKIDIRIDELPFE